MNIRQIDAYQRKYKFAGTMDQLRFAGCDMPLDAKFIARLPLSVMRRVLPFKSYSEYQGIAANWSGVHEAELFEYSSETIDGHFRFIVKNTRFYSCGDCAGSGFHLIGEHSYECKNCSGTGHGEDQNEVLAACLITVGGTVVKSESWQAA